MIDTNRNLLLFSSSRSRQDGFLEAGADVISETLNGCKNVLFITYAIVEQVSQRIEVTVKRFNELAVGLNPISGFKDAREAIAAADAIVVSGGNSFCLLKGLYDNDLLPAIRARISEGVPYIGWSAGSNVSCPTIRTTNDMPIVEPPSLSALELIPFQINPHFTNALPPGHKGETREMRISEFVTVNPEIYVIGIPEGGWLRIKGMRIELGGPHPVALFRGGEPRRVLQAGDDLGFLLRN